jgi:prepilin-type N-terminal cleavage/methylation domain-containing protein
MKLNPQTRNINQEKGISFLEILVVLAILGVTASLVMPNFGSWRNKSLIEADVEALVSQIEYIKARVALINGTGVLIVL